MTKNKDKINFLELLRTCTRRGCAGIEKKDRLRKKYRRVDDRKIERQAKID